MATNDKDSTDGAKVGEHYRRKRSVYEHCIYNDLN